MCAASAARPVLVEGVTKTFEDSTAVDDLTLMVHPGELLVLLGPSGCGKTTTLRMIAGLERPDRGRVFIGDARVDHLPPKDRDVAMVFQDYALYPHMTVFDNIAFPLKIKRRVQPSEIQARVKSAAELVGLVALLDRRPAQMSGGEQQRVALARAFVREPRVFLMDEPLANLDAKLKVQMRAELQVLHRRLGVTTICVSHDQLDAMTLGGRIAIMDRGRVRQIGTPSEVYSRPSDLFVAGFLGTPPMNFLTGSVSDAGGEQRIALKGLDAASPTPPDASKVQTGREVVVGIRPEGLRIATADDGIVSGRVFVLEPVGSDTYAYLRLENGQSLVIRTAPDIGMAIDDVVPVTWARNDVHIFDKESGVRIG